MEKTLRFISSNILIITIILIASYLRFVGINPGYPEHTDEGGYSSALVMILDKNFDPGRYDYPAGLPILHYFLFKILFIPVGWLKFYLVSLGPIIDGFIRLPLNVVEYQQIFKLNILGERFINVMYWGRYVTAFFGVTVTLLTYFLSKKIFNKSVGLIASFLVAVNFRQVLNSHIGLPDIYNSFFLLLTIYFCYSVFEKPNKINYFLAGLFNALYFSIKFQTFGFLPILVAHLMTFRKKVDHLKLILAFLTSAFFMALLNPYLFIKFEIFKSIQTYQLSKYGIGSNAINVYPLSYLYHIGIGNIISVLIIIGIVYCAIFYFRKSFILCLVTFQFLLTFVYLSKGGFYTRNFVTITPILIIFGSVLISDVFAHLSKKMGNKWLINLALFTTVIAISIQNIQYSYIVGREYSKEWNKNVLSKWISNNIPKNSKVAAHSNTPLPVDGVTHSIFEPDEFFSIDEFAGEGAEYAISNSSWTTNSFYWWMGGPFKEASRHLWNKPVDVLEYSYPALALRELEQFNVYSISNPWQAPDTDFLVAKIPKYKVNSKIMKKSFNFNNSVDEWNKSGLFWATSDNLGYENGSLVVLQEPPKLPSIRWESPVIDVSDWDGFIANYQIKTEDNPKNLRTGYLFVSFYNSIDDAKNSINRTGLRLSERNIVTGSWIKKELIGTIPENSEYMTIGFSNYSPAQSKVLIDNINIYDADVQIDFNGVDIFPTHVDQNNLFLNSHGNL